MEDNRSNAVLDEKWQHRGRMAIYIWIDATYLTVRCGRRIVSVAADIAVGVNVDGRREVLGL